MVQRDASDDDGASARARPADNIAAEQLRRLVIGLLLGLGVGLLAMVVVLRIANRDVTPPLTPQQFHAARERARLLTPANYDIEVRVTGTQPALYRVEVRNKQAVAAWRNGQPLTSQRTFGTWSVPGMFGTISRDAEAIERHLTGKADPATPRLTLRAEFDPQYGYPSHYRRVQQWSTVEVAWEVTMFRPLP